MRCLCTAVLAWLMMLGCHVSMAQEPGDAIDRAVLLPSDPGNATGDGATADTDAPEGKKANDQSSISITGVTQVEYLSNFGAADNFWPRRVRLAVVGKSRDRLDGKLQIDYDRFRRLGLKDLYVTAYFSDISVRVGQQKMPFSEEVLFSSTKREPLERPRVTRALWPGERDIGVTFSTNPRNKHGGSLIAGVYLGEGATTLDANAGKDIIVKYAQHFDDGQGKAFVAYHNGSVGAVPVAKSFFGGGAAWHDSDDEWRFYGEAHMGTMGTPFLGGFVRGVHRFDGGDHSVFAQVQYWDADTGTAGTQWGPVVGYIWQAGRDTKFTLQYDGDRQQVGGRVQVSFD